MASGLGNYMMKSVGPSRTGGASPAAQLYRAIAKEVPRVLTIYDIDMDFAQVGACFQWREEGWGANLMRLHCGRACSGEVVHSSRSLGVLESILHCHYVPINASYQVRTPLGRLSRSCTSRTWYLA